MIRNYNLFINERKFYVSYTNKTVDIDAIYTSDDVYAYVQRMHKLEDDFYDGDLGERIEEFTTYKVANIPIDKIDIDKYLLNDEVVEDYIKIYQKLETYPPIVLGYYDKGSETYDIIDGTHRVNALSELGITEIICFVGMNKKQPSVV